MDDQPRRARGQADPADRAARAATEPGAQLVCAARGPLGMPDNMLYPVPGTCPVCGNELVVTRLRCGNCRTTLEGLFSLGRFYYLTREQQQFIAVFVKCRGKIKDVEDELGISYP